MFKLKFVLLTCMSLIILNIVLLKTLPVSFKPYADQTFGSDVYFSTYDQEMSDHPRLNMPEEIDEQLIIKHARNLEDLNQFDRVERLELHLYKNTENAQALESIEITGMLTIYIHHEDVNVMEVLKHYSGSLYRLRIVNESNELIDLNFNEFDQASQLVSLNLEGINLEGTSDFEQISTVNIRNSDYVDLNWFIQESYFTSTTIYLTNIDHITITKQVGSLDYHRSLSLQIDNPGTIDFKTVTFYKDVDVTLLRFDAHLFQEITKIKNLNELHYYNSEAVDLTPLLSNSTLQYLEIGPEIYEYQDNKSIIELLDDDVYINIYDNH